MTEFSSVSSTAPAPPAAPVVCPPDGDEALIRQTCRISTIEGVFAQVYMSLAAPGSVFLTKFAVMLGASPFQFGLLAAFGQLSQVFQPLGALLSRRLTTRRGLVVRLVAGGRTLTFFFGLLPFLLPERFAIGAFLALFLAATSIQAVGGNAWIAWICDMVPLARRGRFLARRSQYLLIAGLLTGYTFGGLVDLFEPPSGALAARLHGWLGAPAALVPANMPFVFMGIFGLATLVGVVGAFVLARQPEQPKAIETDGALALLAAPLKDPNFRRLLLYGCWWMLAVGIGAPFWQPFMIRKLQMSLVDIQIYGTISALASMAVLRAWGAFIDRFGNKAAMRIAIVMAGMNPLVWLLPAPRHYWILYFEAASSGIMWSGAGIVATNFVMAIAPAGRRQIYSGLFGAVSGLAMMATMILSGIFLPPPLRLGKLHLEPEQVLFGITGLLRWSTLIPLAWIREPLAASVGETFIFMRQFAKVWIAHLAERRLFRR